MQIFLHFYSLLSIHLKRLLFIFILLFSQQLAFSQQELYVGGEFIGGILGGSALETDLLKQRNYSPTLGGQVNLSIRMFDRIAIEGGIGQHWSRVRLIDRNFAEQAEDFSIKIKNTNYHWNYYAAVSTFIRIKQTDSYFYGKFALSFNRYSEESVSEQSSLVITSQNIDRELDYTTTYKGSNYSLIPEVGIQHKFFKGNVLSLGLRYNIGQSTAFESEYTVNDNLNGESTSDGLTSKGSAFTFTVRYDFRLYHIPDREKPKKKRRKLDDIAIDLNDESDDQIVKKEDEHKQEYKDEGRKIVVSERIKVQSSTVKIQIWDHQSVDGDRVSLVLNDEWILENYTLEKEPFEMVVELIEGVNTFVLHALNLGKIRPNTAAILVIEGDKEHKLTLQSNMDKSGTLQIKYEK